MSSPTVSSPVIKAKGHPPYGWRKEPMVGLVHDEYEQSIISLIKELSGQNATYQMIADELNERGHRIRKKPDGRAAKWRFQYVASIMARARGEKRQVRRKVVGAPRSGVADAALS